MKLDKVKPVKQQLSSIQPEVVFLGSVVKIQKIKRTQHVLCRISYISYDIEFLHNLYNWFCIIHVEYS